MAMLGPTATPVRLMPPPNLLPSRRKEGERGRARGQERRERGEKRQHKDSNSAFHWWRRLSKPAHRMALG